MSPYLILAILLIAIASVASQALCWRYAARLLKHLSLKPDSESTALLEKRELDPETAELIQQIHDNVLVVSRSEVVLAGNQQVVVNELGALRKEFADLAFAIRTLNAAAKRTAAEEATRAATPDPRVSLREQIKVVAEAAEAARPRETVAQMQARSGLIAPGKCPLPGGIPHPQDSLPKK